MPKPRSPVLGYNHNLKHKGWTFHVQTEDSGVHNPHIYTHMFHGGVIIASKRLDYDAEADDDIVKGLMQAQHKSLMKELRHGVYDAKIDSYLGPAPAGPEGQAVPQELVEDVSATVPTSTLSEVELLDLETTDAMETVAAVVEDSGSGSSSSPYMQIEVGAEGQGAVSGTLSVADLEPEIVSSVAMPPPAPGDTDDEINGLLNRLREETPEPEHVESPGAWLVSRPGQKERPFDRSGPVPTPVRDDMPRRVLTPPAIPEMPPPRHAPSTPAPPVVGLRRPSGGRPATPPPVSVRAPTVAPTPPPGAARSRIPPTRPLPPTPPPIPPMRPPPPVTPILPRAPSGSAVRSGVGPPPLRSPSNPPPSRSQPLPPVLPRASSAGPLGARPAIRPSGPTPPTGSRMPTSPPAVTITPRRPSTQESAVVARPAVVIGAPPTVIGGPGDQTGRHRAHARESHPVGGTGESLFGQDLISEKSLDEVIMAYLSEESSED